MPSRHPPMRRTLRERHRAPIGWHVPVRRLLLDTRSPSDVIGDGSGPDAGLIGFDVKLGSRTCDRSCSDS